MNWSDDLGKLILRLTLGVMMLFHGVAKITGGVAFIERLLQGVGLPGWIAYGVYFSEILAPLLLIVGWYSRVAAAIVAIEFGFILWLVRGRDVFVIHRGGGWGLELEALYIAIILAVLLVGPGRFAINRR